MSTLSFFPPSDLRKISNVVSLIKLLESSSPSFLSRLFGLKVPPKTWPTGALVRYFCFSELPSQPELLETKVPSLTWVKRKPWKVVPKYFLSEYFSRKSPESPTAASAFLQCQGNCHFCESERRHRQFYRQICWSKTSLSWLTHRMCLRENRRQRKHCINNLVYESRCLRHKRHHQLTSWPAEASRFHCRSRQSWQHQTNLGRQHLCDHQV